jgi:MoaA/NifB/PqqE/SkfB family radical SAM enzyme
MANIGYIQVNRHCNNACHFCSNPSNGNNITYERWVELIEEFIERKYRGIIFTGWEPTLSPDLPRWIAYARDKWIESRIISNGMMCAKMDYMKRLADAWLELVHFSVYSYNPKIHDFLTDTPGSWIRLMQSIKNAHTLGVRVQINTVINHYNQQHLDVTIQFLIKQFPFLNHFVWNNLDPLMMRKSKVALSTLPNFHLFEASLHNAMKLLHTSWKTFRVERVPLCYMRGFEDCSTETRKIVKDEERIVYFLDEREKVEQRAAWFIHDKSELCKKCDLNPICAWIWMSQPFDAFWKSHAAYYSDVQYKPQKITQNERKEILAKILN